MDIVKMTGDALKPIADRGVVVREGWYDEKQKELHVTIWPLTITPDAAADDAPDVLVGQVQITIFSTREQEQLRAEIVELMLAAGALYLGTDQQETRIEAGVYIRPLRFNFIMERE